VAVVRAFIPSGRISSNTRGQVVEHDRVRRRPGPAHEPRAAAPRDDGTVERPRDPEDRGDLCGRDREDDRGGGLSGVVGGGSICRA